MARVRTGYTGRDGRGRPTGPLSRDIGAASAATDGLAALGRLSALRSVSALLVDTAQAAGAGPVTTRRESAGERTAREARDAAAIRVRPQPARVTPIHPTRPHAAAPVTPSAKEEFAMPATVTAPPHAVPCGTCAHAVVCGFKASLEALGPLEPVQIIDTGFRAVATAYRLECDHYLEQAAPMRIRAASIEELQASRQRGAAATSKVYAERRAATSGGGRGANNAVLSRDPQVRQAQVLEAVRATKTTEEAGKRLGVTATRVQQILGEMRRQGTLPAEVATTLTARRSGRALAIDETPAVAS